MIVLEAGFGVAVITIPALVGTTVGIAMVGLMVGVPRTGNRVESTVPVECSYGNPL